MRQLLERATAAWDRFFFTPVSTSTVALVRIAFGVVLLGWTLSVGPDVRTFFSGQGLLAAPPSRRWTVGLLHVLPSDTVVVGLWVVLLVAALAMIVGLGSRVASVVAFVALLSFQRRNPWVLNSGDLLLRHLAFFLMFAPTGAALSLDRWLRHREAFWDHPSRAAWPLRLIQLQLAIGYFFAVWAKVQGSTWNQGTAVGYAWQIGDIVRFPLPEVLIDSVILVNLATWATLALELALATAVWNRKLRPWVLGAGVLMHLGIDLTIEVGFFSYAIFVGYLAFLPPETADRYLAQLRQRLRREEPGVSRRAEQAA